MVKAGTTKKVAGVFKKEIEKGGGLLGQLIDEKFGHLFDDPTVRDLAYRVIGLGIESLEGAFSKDHPLLGPGTSVLSDFLEQATPFFVGEQRGAATKKSKRSKGSDVQAPTTKQPDWIDEWWKAARIRMSREIKGGGVYFDAADFAQLLRNEFDILWGIHQKMVEISTPERLEPIPTDYDAMWSKVKLLEIADQVGARVYKSWTNVKIVEAIDKKLGVVRKPEREPMDLDLAATLNNARGNVQKYRKDRQQRRAERQENTKEVLAS